MMPSLLCLTVLWAAMVSVVSAAALWRARHPPRPWPAKPLPPYILLRPCAGRETHLLSNLISSQHVCGPTPVCTVLGAEASDPALDILQDACARLQAAGQQATWQITAANSPNPKVGQLAELTPSGLAGEAVYVYADSDVDLAGYRISDLLAPLTQPEVAAVWAPFFEPTPRSLGDHASAGLLGGSLHSFALLHHLDRDGMVGKLLAVKPAALREVGGWTCLGNVLGEDMELGRRLRAAAWRVVPSQSCVRARPSSRSTASVLARWRRWLWVVRAQRPRLLWSYPLLFCATLPLLALCAALASQTPYVAAFLATSILLCRWQVARGARRLTQPQLSKASWRWVPLELLMCLTTDGLLALAWLGVLGRRRVRWRARTLHIDMQGRMHEPVG